MNLSTKRWFYIIILSLVWGSSFILMKKSLVGLSPLQVGSLRIIFASLALFSVGFKKLKELKKENLKPIVITAAVGTFFPVFLFAFAIHDIDSAIASILNSLTPLNTLIVGGLFFGIYFNNFQKIGVLIGFLGTVILRLSSAKINTNQQYIFALLPVIASIGYAFNLNIIKKYLQNVSPLSISTGNFAVMFIPAILVLYFSGFFTDYHIGDEKMNRSLFYLMLLSVFGTALAKTLYNKLIQLTTTAFSSSVTYLIPVVAVMWGVIDGEKFLLSQILASVFIFFGIYLSSKKLK